MSYLARGPAQAGIDSQTSAAGRRRADGGVATVGPEAAA
jgi:hypothetical protein